MRKLTWLLPVAIILLVALATTVSVSAQDNFEVTDLSISPDSVAAREYVTQNAKVTNTKDTEETYSVELKLNREVEDSQELLLGAGQSDNITTVQSDNITGQASFWSIFPSWVWIVIIAIIVVLIILVIVIVAMPSRKKQPGTAIKGRQGQPTAQAAPFPTPIPSTGSTSPQMGYPPPMPTQTPEAFPTPGQFPVPGPMAAPYPQYARRPIFSVSNLTITPNQVKSGEPVTINAIVSNNGSEAGTYSVVLRINNVVEHITDLILTPGASQSATFTIIKDIGGDYYAEVDGLSGTFIVIPLVPANFSVSNLVISPERAKQGETISISAMVTNNGEIAGNYSLVLKLKGAVETTKEIDLGPGESQKVTFDINKNTPGFYNVELEGLTGRFVIEMEWQK
jgi:flagellar basal body-associated protein FliL